MAAAKFLGFQGQFGASQVKVGAYSPDTGRIALVTHFNAVNVLAINIKITVERDDGSTKRKVCNQLVLEPGDAFTFNDIGKPQIPAGGGIFVTSDTAASVDVTMSVYEKDQT